MSFEPCSGMIERPVQDYAKSGLYVAKYNMTTPGGDLRLAKEYLERVATSNAEEVSTATAMLAELKVAIAIVEAKMHADAQSKAAEASQASTIAA
jgi:hypothetical protein